MEAPERSGIAKRLDEVEEEIDRVFPCKYAYCGKRDAVRARNQYATCESI